MSYIGSHGRQYKASSNYPPLVTLCNTLDFFWATATAVSGNRLPLHVDPAAPLILKVQNTSSLKSEHYLWVCDLHTSRLGTFMACIFHRRSWSLLLLFYLSNDIWKKKSFLRLFLNYAWHCQDHLQTTQFFLRKKGSWRGLLLKYVGKNAYLITKTLLLKKASLLWCVISDGQTGSTTWHDTLCHSLIRPVK